MTQALYAHMNNKTIIIIKKKKQIIRERWTNKQGAKQTNKHIKKFLVLEQENFSLSSSGVTHSASSPGFGIQADALSWSRQVARETHQFIFLSFSSSCLVSSSLSELWLVCSFQRSALWPTSHLALQLGFCCVGLLGTCFFASSTFFGARSEIHQLTPCCQCVMLVY
jgi:hypothetical protein